MQKKWGLCLGAGGSRGVAHVGFLAALEEEGLRPDVICGCSMGSVVGGAYAAGLSPKQIQEVVFSLKMGELLSFDLRANKNVGFFRTDKMRDLLMTYLGTVTFDDLKLPFRCVATDLLTCERYVFQKGFLVDAIVASSSIPSFFQPTILSHGECLVDGGIVDRVPVDLLKDMGAEITVAVDVLATLRKIDDLPSGVLPTFFRIVGVMDEGQTQLLKEKRKQDISLWVEPDLHNMDPYSLKEVAFAYDRGYEWGKRNIKKIKGLLA